MPHRRCFQTFRPGKAQKLLRWSAVNLFSLFLVSQIQLEHTSAKIVLAAVLGLSLTLLLAFWWKNFRYESRREFFD
jgi:hypothetical protein